MTVPFLTTQTPATPVQKFLNEVIIPAINAGIAAAGTVTNFSAVGNDGITVNVTNPTTTPQITIGLGGTLTPAAVAASGTVTGSNLSGTNTGDVTLAGQNYLSISGQIITAHPIDLATGNITGNLGVGHLNGGVNANSGTFWRGDQSWVAIPPAITSVAITGTGITVGGSPLSPPGGTITLSLTATGVSAGTYNHVTVGVDGRVSAATLENYPTYTGATGDWIPFVTGGTPGVLANSIISYNLLGVGAIGPVTSKWVILPNGTMEADNGFQVSSTNSDTGGIPFGYGTYANTSDGITLASQSGAALMGRNNAGGTGPIGTVKVISDVVATGATITVANGAWNGTKGSTTDIPLTILAKGASPINIGSPLALADAMDITVGTSTGTKIGTATSQKLGFFNKSPIIQPTTTGTTTGFTAGAGTPVLDDSTFTGNTGSAAYTIGDIVNALKLLGLLAA